MYWIDKGCRSYTKLKKTSDFLYEDNKPCHLHSHGSWKVIYFSHFIQKKFSIFQTLTSISLIFFLFSWLFLVWFSSNRILAANWKIYKIFYLIHLYFTIQCKQLHRQFTSNELWLIQRYDTFSFLLISCNDYELEYQLICN